jgi:photosystem II stability/assembly factor-like uncharacterized protein
VLFQVEEVTMGRVFAIAVGVVVGAGTWARAADLRYFEDAALRAVHFVDAKEGWAVGDEGVVWHTIDGGATWERQPSGTRASLRSVQFFNPFVGWIAGREEAPQDGASQGRTSVGVLLFTRDGGLSWQRILPNSLPGLNGVRFTGAKTGYVFGDGSEQFPTGVFRTDDGGRTWAPVPGPRFPAWLGGAFLDGQTGLLAGPWSRLVTYRDGAFGQADLDVKQLGGRSLTSAHNQGGLAMVVVGQGGLVLTSQSRGTRWGYAKLNLSPEVLASLDFQAVHGVGRNIWIVGRPGSVALHSADLGATWKLVRTGHPLPLNGVYFTDPQRGWAVGELGSILATVDGGQTWKVQRQGGKRSAVLLVHARPDDVPVESLARWGAEEGYLASALRVVAPDPASSAFPRAADPQRFAAGVRLAGAAGGETLWQFPLPQHLRAADRQALLQYWNQLHGGRADRQMLRQMVLALRTWRPNVIVTDHPDAKITGNAAAALTAEAVHEAIRQAADPKAFSEQINDLDLPTWSVTKTYALWDKREQAQVVVDGDEARPQLGASARDFAAAAVALLQNGRDLPRQRYFRLLESRDADSANAAHLLGGIALEPGGEARRRLPDDAKPDPDLLKAYKARRQLETLAVNLTNPDRTLAQIGPMLAGLPDDHGAAAALAIGRQYVRQGQWSLAREAFLLMVDRYPAHPLSAEAYRWLIRHISSSEARRRHELEQFLIVSNISFSQGPMFQPLPLGSVEKPKRPGIYAVKAEAGEEPKKPASPKTDAQGTRMVREGAGVYLSDRSETRQWYRGSLEFARRLAGFGPLFAADPAIQFCLQSSQRNLGNFDGPRKWYGKFQTHFPKGPWHDAAAAELWLENRQGPPPKPIASCRYTGTRPLLDGKLDDACWQGLKPIELGNAVGSTAPDKAGSQAQAPRPDYPTQAWLAYDEKYIYIALRCQHPAGKRVPPVKGRKRDADLTAYDRVSILLDLDRDYSTYFHLQVDQRGCLREDCWGDVGWNPRWFVAVHSTDTCWQIEAALPLSELTGDRVRKGTAWAFNVVRILPGQGVQAFSLPADLEPRPEGMGLLLFTQAAQRQ